MVKKLIIKNNQEITACAIAQKNLCKEKNYPDFAPSIGVCWSCRRNIYQNYGWNKGNWNRPITEDGAEVDYVTGISVEEAGSELVTGCPHCHKSYCD